MTPIDDELRAVLTSRAGALPPSADPLTGIEQRAARIHRTRVARTVAGTALAVALVAVGVPAALGGAAQTHRGGLATVPSVPVPATPAPRSEAPAPTPAPKVAASTPAGRPSAAATASTSRPAGALSWPSKRLTVAHAAFVDLWAAAHPGSGPVQGEVLLGAVLPTSDPVYVLQLWRTGVAPRIVVVTVSRAQPLLVRDDPVPASVSSLEAVVAAGTTPYVVVVGAPAVTRIDYAADGVHYATQATGRTALFARTGPTAAVPDLVRTLDAKSHATVQAVDPGGGPASSSAEPSNLLSTWPSRGTPSAGPSQDEAATAFATALGRPGASARLRVLFAGGSDGGLRYLLGQAWIAGEGTAYTFGYTTGGESGPEVFLGPITPAAPEVLAYLLCCSPGATTDTLVVVPQPGTGQVLYDDGSGPHPVGVGQDNLDGVVLVDRDPRASTDRLQLLDGDGRQSFNGPVAPLLCALSGCG